MVQEPAPADQLARSLEQRGGDLGVSPEERKLLGPMAWTATAPGKRPTKRDRRLIHSFRGDF